MRWSGKIPVTLNFKTICAVFHSNTVPINFLSRLCFREHHVNSDLTFGNNGDNSMNKLLWQVCSDRTTQEPHKDGTDGLKQRFSSSRDRMLCGNTLFLLAGWAGSKVPHLYLPVLINDISSLPCSLFFFFLVFFFLLPTYSPCFSLRLISIQTHHAGTSRPYWDIPRHT